ncbi:MAG TPA: flavodoxin domain-containing protein [Methylophilaceae bacterium]|nr:flavodoxin domain-containing protein [Methylophilaceae bacterium]
MSRSLLALVIVAAYILFSVWCFRRSRQPDAITKKKATDILVAFASQTGHAEQLAQQTADTIRSARKDVRVSALNEVTSDELKRYKRVLFIVSTTGEGDPPDTATDFVLNVMASDADFQSLEYGLLALGDRRYSYFCGFGHTLDAWLQHSHALPIFDMVEVDNSDAGALRHWQSQLGLLTGMTETADWSAPEYQPWRLVERSLLNPGSAGGPVYHLKLEALQAHEGWLAGDIAEIGPRNDPGVIVAFMDALNLTHIGVADEQGTPWNIWLTDKLLPHTSAEIDALRALPPSELAAYLKLLPHREYSIASLPEDGLELVVRQVRNADGQLGHGSGWLTEYVGIGAEVALRIRSNPMFHPPAQAIPLILIGNGTGIAGLRAHLQASVRAGQQRHWLIFGERNAAYDAYFMKELQEFKQQGSLARLDIAYSRDQAAAVYVQDILLNTANELKDWINAGAAILVCGSATGMAPAVHHVLGNILGEDILAALATSGRYRRDIY